MEKLFIITDKTDNITEVFKSEDSFLSSVVKRGIKRYSDKKILTYSFSGSFGVDGYLEAVKRNKIIDGVLSDNMVLSVVDEFVKGASKYTDNKEFMDTISIFSLCAELKKYIKSNKISLFFYVSNEVGWYDLLLSIYNFNIEAFNVKLDRIANRDVNYSYDPLTCKKGNDVDFELAKNNFEIAYKKRNSL